jgi:hypothetical protein
MKEEGLQRAGKGILEAREGGFEKEKESKP